MARILRFGLRIRLFNAAATLFGKKSKKISPKPNHFSLQKLDVSARGGYYALMVLFIKDNSTISLIMDYL
jgi:hypothetical protein